MPPRIVVFKSGSDLVHGAATAMVDLLHDAALRRGSAAIALSGGSTPRSVYELLATDQFRGKVDWNTTHLFWGDERCVPPNAPDSNYRMVKESLLDKVPVPSTNIHRAKGELLPVEAAHQYEDEIRKHFGSATPAFDLLLLGIGEDGHTASLFPGTAALSERSRVVTEVFVPKLNAHRVTLTFPVINNAGRVVILVSGKTKASIVREILEVRPGKYPSEQVSPTSGSLYWYLDADAASMLSEVEPV